MLKHKEDHENCADLLGIHLEGPFLSVEFKGAMPESLLRGADIELLREYQEKPGEHSVYYSIAGGRGNRNPFLKSESWA